MFTDFIPHVFLVSKKRFTIESYKCKFKLVELASEQAREIVNASCLNVNCSNLVKRTLIVQARFKKIFMFTN